MCSTESLVKSDKLRGDAVGFAEDVDIAEFFTLWRILLVVAGMADSIGFLRTPEDDFAVVVLVVLAAMDNALLGECAAYFGKRDLEVDDCHNRDGYVKGCKDSEEKWFVQEQESTTIIMFLRCGYLNKAVRTRK